MLNKQLGITLILVTHDVATVTDKVTHVACINKTLHFHGNACEYNELDEEELSSIYGHGVHCSVIIIKMLEVTHDFGYFAI